MICEKTDFGYMTSDPGIAAALWCTGAEYAGLGEATRNDIPGVVLTRTDENDKLIRELQGDLAEATRMVRHLGYNISGVYKPERHVRKVFLFKGDPEELQKIVLDFSNGKLKTEASDFHRRYKDLVTLVRG